MPLFLAQPAAAYSLKRRRMTSLQVKLAKNQYECPFIKIICRIILPPFTNTLHFGFGQSQTF
jgi:hypothetical protein